MTRRSHRGVLLLIVLALLAMFSMVAVAFVIMARTERMNSDNVRRNDQVVDSPQKTLQQAVNIVARGTYVNPNLAPTTSAITWQSLLEKIYGFERIGTPDSSPIGTQGSSAMLTNMSQNSLICGGQLIEFALPTTNPDTTTFANAPIDPLHYVGCVLTMLDGPNAGLSTRIVGLRPEVPPTPPSKVQMLAFEGGVLPSQNNNFLNGNHYIVNGFPYSGMGFGFNPGPGNGSGGLSQVSLTPNCPPANWYGARGIIAGGVNGDYTAPDYQDPLLALAIPTAGLPAPYNIAGIRVPIPSLHRSDLIAHTKAAGNATLLRQVMFRPNSIDHPLFTGSNPNFNPTWDGLPYDINGKPVNWSWDVDNDGDGIADSVWVDLGMPVRFTTDGKAYKPLFAILCLDMDGRLNLNAHGNLAQSNSSAYYQSPQYQAPNLQNYQPVTNLDVGLGTTPTPTYFAGPFGSTLSTVQIALPRGQGAGPGEVNLLPLFRTPYPPPAQQAPSFPNNFLWANYQAVLSGGGGTMGRYGPAVPPGLPSLSSQNLALPGSNPNLANIAGSPLTLNNAFPYNGSVQGTMYNGLGTYWQNFQSVFDAYGSPPDSQGTGIVALDRAGRPLYISMGGQVANGPHDIDLTRNAPHGVDQALVDNAYSVAEMEHILRIYDRDASELPARLAYLTGGVNNSFLPARRAEFTTESRSVPVSGGPLPLALRSRLNLGTPDAQRSSHPVDILYGYMAANNAGANPKLVATQLLPWEVLQGLKMDLNRPFGAGAFSLTSGMGQLTVNGAPTGAPPTVPDQPGTTNEQIKQYTSASGATALAKFNYSADAGVASKVNGAAVNNSLQARQLYARHLYVLMLLLADTKAMLANMQKANPGATPDDVYRMLAQWAVNVVAYRDHNDIMIPFPYDTNPFVNGWNPDNTPMHTVWGCKRPALLITETLAFHDIRTQDRNDEVVNPKKPLASPKRTKPGLTSDTDPTKKDPSFNSKFRPQGSLFVEFHNPWTIVEPRTTDLGSNQNGIKGVQLNKVTPVVNGKSSPVWRLVIVDPSLPRNAPPTIPAPTQGDELPDPDNPNVSMTVNSRPVIERAAYFTSLAGMTIDLTPSASYCLSTQNPAGGPNPATVRPIVVPPGGYAVVGSSNIGSAPGNPDLNRTYIGFANGQTAGNFASNRLVTMNQSDLTDGRVVRNAGDLPPSANPPQVLGIDYNFTANIYQRLSVSEPTRGYPRYELDPKNNPAGYSAANGQYTVTLDIPVDQQRYLIDGEVFHGTSIWTWLNTQGTIPAYRIVYLQRLADPTRPFSPDVPGAAGYAANPQQWNPYRTVDAMTVDLTTFNGLGPYPSKDPTATVSSTHFEAHQRGELNYLPQGTASEMNLWKQEPALKGTPSPAPGWQAAHWVGGGTTPSGNMNYPLPLGQTLGYLNKPFGQPSTAPNTKGDPQYPFNWLNWSYRPFHNAYELMLVPTVSSSRLLARNTRDPRRNFSYVDGAVRSLTNAGGYQPQDVYDPPSSSQFQPANPTPAQISAQLPYPHLLNFFESTQSSGTGVSAQLQRLFAYVGVPSRFANAQLQIPAVEAGVNNNTQHLFHTPFNRVSRYQAAGRVNLNTVTSPDVLMGAMNIYYSPLVVQPGFQLNPVFFSKFVRSRRGDPSVSATSYPLNDMLQFNPTSMPFPSRFMHPYRTPGGAYLSAPTAGGASTEPPRETDVSLLRGDPDKGLNTRPLLEVDDYLMNATAQPTTPDKFSTSSQPNTNLACMDFDRNPYFRYQAIQKLGSVASNHSNVFAVWITVGYFEVKPWPNGADAGHPDGYQLGEELGSDTGDIIRHRAFYIFDRSIPVGFVRGKDLNQDNAFLLKRFIE